jgi:glycosyltransferase involved in cell wall biosynthesis
LSTGATITPVVLTWNEAPNIERTLSRLGWAQRVLVVDSGSDDGTQERARRFANVVLVERAFDSHATQWELGIRHPEVVTDWVLALDADYVLGEELVAELGSLDLGSGPRGYRARFRYCIEGEPLRASLYPPVVVLFDRRAARYEQVGHTQRLKVRGEVGLLRGRIDHDDRKPYARFVETQRRYAALEAARLTATPWRILSWSGRVRRLRFVTPLAVPLWLLVVRGLLLDGRRGLAYVRQRWLAEASIARALGEEGQRSPRR